MRFGTVKGGVLSPSRQRKIATKPLTVRAFLAVAARLARELRLVTPRARLGIAHGLAEAAEQPFRFRWAMNWRPFNQSSVGMCMSARPRPRMLCPHRGRAGRNPITSCSICRCCLSACTERLQSTSIRPNFLLESSIVGLGQLPDCFGAASAEARALLRYGTAPRPFWLRQSLVTSFASVLRSCLRVTSEGCAGSAKILSRNRENLISSVEGSERGR
jgi:hypothetical protein